MVREWITKELDLTDKARLLVYVCVVDGHSGQLPAGLETSAIRVAVFGPATWVTRRAIGAHASLVVPFQSRGTLLPRPHLQAQMLDPADGLRRLTKWPWHASR